MNAPEKLIGAPVRREEDYRFLTGNGQYTDDVTLPARARLFRPLAARARRASAPSTRPRRWPRPA